MTIRDIGPLPPPGAARDALVDRADARIDAARAAITTVVESWLTRLHGVSSTRLRGPVARKSTRWWSETKSAGFDFAPTGAEYKAVDAGYVLPDRLVEELREPLEGVVLRVALDVADDTVRDLGSPRGGEVNPFAVDRAAVNSAVADAVAAILGVAQRHAEQIRDEILSADASADSLDEMLDMVEAAYRRGGPWVLMAGRTLATALANDTALRQARALGLTHKQWLSRRDGRVRRTHVIADGQTQPIDDRFDVGLFRMDFPADPVDLPDSWPEVANCRCSLIFPPKDADRDAAARMIATARAGRDDAGRRLVDAIAALTPSATPASLDDAGAPVFSLDEPVVAFRSTSGVADVVGPGTVLTLAAGTVLTLAVPVAAADTLAVLLPVDTVVTGGGALLALAEATTVEVVAVESEAGRVDARAVAS